MAIISSLLDKKLITKISLFFVLAFGISYFLNLIQNPLVSLGFKVNLNYAFGPFLSAIFVAILYKTPLSLRLFSKTEWIRKIEFIGLGIFVIGSMAGFILASKTNELMLLSTIFLSLIYTLLEELGWRVFLGNELRNYSFWVIVSISTILWFFWHYSFGDENLLSNPAQFLVLIAAGSAGMAQFYRLTKSWMLVAVTHAVISLNIPTIVVFLVVTIGLLKWQEKQELKIKLTNSL